MLGKTKIKKYNEKQAWNRPSFKKLFFWRFRLLFLAKQNLGFLSIFCPLDVYIAVELGKKWGMA